MVSSKKVGSIKSVRLVATFGDANLVVPTASAHEELRTSEIRYRRLFEAARDGILILDADTLKITDVNPFMIELLGYSHEEFLGRELWEIGLFGDKEASQDAFRELQNTGYLRYEDLPLVTRYGQSREVEFVSNVYEEDGNQVIQCNIRDITDRRHADEERSLLLERAQVARKDADIANSFKDEFLAILSHELRTPLTAILGWSHLLMTGNLDEQETDRAHETIVRNARAQSQLVDDLLDVSRIITGKLRLDVRPVDLAPIIETVVNGMRPAADARNIKLQSALDSSVGSISGDTSRLQQIVWNLITNAIKFTPKGGAVHVWLECIESDVVVTVSDTGQGIDPEFLPFIFDRFRQSDASSTRRQGGLGLGLSIVRQLVELHGGTVSAFSKGIGKGTSFKVKLPLLSVHPQRSTVDIDHNVTPRNEHPNWEPSLDGLRVLVVDDEPDARDLVFAVLTGSGAEVVTAESAEDALTELERQRFDVLVSDIGMPRMDGYALIQQLRQLPAEQGGRIPAAALTAYASVDDRMRILSAGYQMHVPKPVEPSELTAVVASLAGRYAESSTT